MNIVIGQTAKHDLKLDVDVLLRTRMLIQANSISRLMTLGLIGRRNGSITLTDDAKELL